MNTTQYTTIPAGGRITLPTATGHDAPATYEVRVDFMVLAYHLRAAAEAADDWMAAMLLDITSVRLKSEQIQLVGIY
nr:hypothetical protein [uncultured Rhodopila sp.]